MMFRRPTWVALILSAFLIGCNTGITPAPIIIGHISDKTRPDKAGEQAELGIRLALHELNKDDALTNEFKGRKVEVHHTDTRGKLDAFETQAVRLDAINRCLALIGGLSVPETLALNHAKAPLLTLHGQPAPGATQHVLYLGMSPQRQGAVLARALAEDPRSNRITILIDDNRPESIAFAESFQHAVLDARKLAKSPAIAANALRFGEEPKSAPQPTDPGKWGDIAKRMMAQKPDTAVFAGTVRDFNSWHKTLHKQFPAAKLKIVFAGSDGEHRLFELENDEKATILLATAFCPDCENDKIKTFMKAYRDAFRVEADVHSAVAYDGFRMLIDAMKRTANQLTPDQLREELFNTKDFAGLTGPMTVHASGRVQRRLFVAEWKNGNLKLLKAFEAE